MQDEKERQIKELKNKLSRQSTVLIFCGLMIVSAVAAVWLNIGWFLILSALGFAAIIVYYVQDYRLNSKIDILRGYRIDDDVKYILDSKGKVVKKIQGKVVFDE